MIEELRDHPMVYVASAEINAPPTKAQLEEVEAWLGHALPADMRDVYEELGGLELIWRLVGRGEDRAALLAGTPDFSDLTDYSSPYQAVVQLLHPKSWAVNWGDQANFLPEDYEELFGEVRDEEGEADWHRMRLCLIDPYSMWIMAGVTFAPDGRAVVLIGDDHGACFSDHHQVSFLTYLDLVIKSWGWSERARGLKQMFGWDHVVEAADLPAPTLNELIGRIVDEGDGEDEE